MDTPFDDSKPASKAPSDILDPPTNSRDLESNKEIVTDVRLKENPRKDIPTWKWILSLVGLYLGALLYGTYGRVTQQFVPTANASSGLDTTIAADVQASVYQTLGDIQNLPWVGLGFPMASVAVILLLGRAYGLFNIKTLMLTSIAIFEIGSAICGAAPTSNALIFGRVIAGIGGAGMYLG